MVRWSTTVRLSTAGGTRWQPRDLFVFLRLVGARQPPLVHNGREIKRSEKDKQFILFTDEKKIKRTRTHNTKTLASNG